MVLHALCSIIAIIGAVMALRASGIGPDEAERIRERFRARATRLENSAWAQIPGLMVNWLIERRRLFKAIAEWGSTTWPGILLLGGGTGFAWIYLPVELPALIISGACGVGFLLLTLSWILNRWMKMEWVPRTSSLFDALALTLVSIGALLIGWAIIKTLQHNNSLSTHLIAGYIAFGLCLVPNEVIRGILDSIHYYLYSSYLLPEETDIQSGLFL